MQSLHMYIRVGHFAISLCPAPVAPRGPLGVRGQWQGGAASPPEVAVDAVAHLLTIAPI